MLAPRDAAEVVRCDASIAISRLEASSISNEMQLVKSGTVPPLISMIESPSPTVQEMAWSALQSFTDPDHKMEIISGGALSQLGRCAHAGEVATAKAALSESLATVLLPASLRAVVPSSPLGAGRESPHKLCRPGSRLRTCSSRDTTLLRLSHLALQ